MSYCVHCGVELADYEKACPLCNTPVIDLHRTESGEPLFPEQGKTENGQRLNRTFLLALIGVVALIPFTVTTLIDLIFSVGMSWSAYVLGAEMCAWVFIFFPILYRGFSPYGYILADMAAGAIYLLLVALLLQSFAWYLPLALPLVLLTGAVTMGITGVLRSRKQNRMAKIGWSVLLVSVLPCGVDICVMHYLSGRLLPIWAWYATVPMLVLGAVILLFSRSNRLTEWIRRKMFL